MQVFALQIIPFATRRNLDRLESRAQLQSSRITIQVPGMHDLAEARCYSCRGRSTFVTAFPRTAETAGYDCRVLDGLRPTGSELYGKQIPVSSRRRLVVPGLGDLTAFRTTLRLFQSLTGLLRSES